MAFGVVNEWPFFGVVGAGYVVHKCVTSLPVLTKSQALPVTFFLYRKRIYISTCSIEHSDPIIRSTLHDSALQSLYDGSMKPSNIPRNVGDLNFSFLNITRAPDCRSCPSRTSPSSAG